MGSIVVGSDGSTTASAAVAEGIDLARRLGAAVIFVSVAPSPPEWLGKPFWQQWVTEHTGRARAALDAARTPAEEAGVDADYELLEGEPADELARFCEGRDADLIVIGNRGLGAIAGVLLGSVSMSLIRRSRRPVVVVREPAERARDAATEARRPVGEVGDAPA
jgi:nucleotide-binding universal stress UspA family protein